MPGLYKGRTSRRVRTIRRRACDSQPPRLRIRFTRLAGPVSTPLSGYVLWAITGYPRPGLPRYNLYLVGFGGLVVGYVRQNVSIRTQSVLTVFVGFLLATGMVMGSPLNTWIFNGSVSGAISDPAERQNSMAAREGVGPMAWSTYKETVEPGSRVGFVLDSAIPYTLYGGNFRVQLEHVGGHEDAVQFHREVIEKDLDYLVLANASAENRWTDETDQYSVLHRSDSHVLYEVADD